MRVIGRQGWLWYKRIISKVQFSSRLPQQVIIISSGSLFSPRQPCVVRPLISSLSSFRSPLSLRHNLFFLFNFQCDPWCLYYAAFVYSNDRPNRTKPLHYSYLSTLYFEHKRLGEKGLHFIQGGVSNHPAKHHYSLPSYLVCYSFSPFKSLFTLTCIFSPTDLTNILFRPASRLFNVCLVDVLPCFSSLRSRLIKRAQTSLTLLPPIYLSWRTGEWRSNWNPNEPPRGSLRGFRGGKTLVIIQIWVDTA